MAFSDGRSGLKRWLNKVLRDGGAGVGSRSPGLTGGRQNQQPVEDENMAWRVPFRSKDDRHMSPREQQQEGDLKRPSGNLLRGGGAGVGSRSLGSTGASQNQRSVEDENMAWRVPFRSKDDRHMSPREQRQEEDLKRPSGNLLRDGGAGVGSQSLGSTGGRQNQRPVEGENMAWRVPFRSKDDRHMSPREQQQEDLKRPSGNLLGRRGWPQDQDEDFEMGNRSSYSPYLSHQYYSTEYRVCGGCNHEISSSNYLACMGTYFHPQCFCCHACGHPIDEQEFSLSGKDPYHSSCFRELTQPKCDVCHQFIPTNAAGMVEYRRHPFWSQTYCPAHEYDNTARCCSCKRLESWRSRNADLRDGRSSCSECLESAVMNTGECQPLYHAIRDFFEGMNMKLDQQIPVLLVDRQALNQAILGENHGSNQMLDIRGLCLFEEQTVSTIRSGPRNGGQRLVGPRTQNLKVTRKSEVTAIVILYGLPRLLTGAILAHELMRGWLLLKGYRNLSPQVEEGLCQVMSYMWLESEVTSGFKPRLKTVPYASIGKPTFSASSDSEEGGRKKEAQKRLGEFFMYQIANDPSPGYGGAFRAANAAVKKYGLHRVLDHVRYAGSFPL